MTAVLLTTSRGDIYAALDLNSRTGASLENNLRAANAEELGVGTCSDRLLPRRNITLAATRPRSPRQ